mgnify:CR=1 FL=1
MKKQRLLSDALLEEIKEENKEEIKEENKEEIKEEKNVDL